jgi:hypothetical protein
MGKFFDTKFLSLTHIAKGMIRSVMELLDGVCGEFIVENIKVRLGAADFNHSIQTVSSGRSLGENRRTTCDKK